MNIFVLCTGRCGSVTFAKACENMANYTVGHETLRRVRPLHLVSGHMTYPANHIEVDNRLSWFLGALDGTYGKEGFYVHLLRRREEVAASYAARGWRSILFAFASSILQYYDRACELSDEERFQVALLYVDTVNANIRQFLRNKPNQVTLLLEEPKDEFVRFWSRIGAQGDLPAALAEWDVRHNVRTSRDYAEWEFPGKELYETKNELIRCRKTVREKEAANKRLVRVVAKLEESLKTRSAQVAKLKESLKTRSAQLEARRAQIRASNMRSEQLEQEVARHQLITRVRRIVAGVVPRDSTVAVASEGDEDMMDLGVSTAWHFPRDDAGNYLGYRPANDADSVGHVELLRACGAEFLLFPRPSPWWPEYYGGLCHHLGDRYPRIWSDDDCVIFRLTVARS